MHPAPPPRHATAAGHLEAGDHFLLALHLAGRADAHLAQVGEEGAEPGVGHDVGQRRALRGVHHQDAGEQVDAGRGHVLQPAAHRRHVRGRQRLNVLQPDLMVRVHKGVAPRQHAEQRHAAAPHVGFLCGPSLEFCVAEGWLQSEGFFFFF